MKPINFKNHEVLRKIDLLGELAYYGIAYVEGVGNYAYYAGGTSTIAHIIACCLAQWFDIDGVPTDSVMEALRFDSPNPPKTKDECVELIKNFLSNEI